MKRTDLHEYQSYCVEFLKSHPQAMLILEMGLGKSVTTLTAILDLMFDSFEVSKTLVVAPLRVAKTVWPAEGENWEHARFLNISVMTGTAKQREAALLKSADVYVINRENVGWLVGWFEKHKKPWPFDMVVLDELSSFKNHNSQRWKAIRKIRPYVKYCFGLTGTPAGNGLMDLWAETLPDRRRHKTGKVHRPVPGGVLPPGVYEPEHRCCLQVWYPPRRGRSNLPEDFRYLRCHEGAGLPRHAGVRHGQPLCRNG